MSSRARLVAVLIFALLGALVFAAAGVAVPRRIVLDHAIGPVSVLETRASVERTLGRGVTQKEDLRQHWVMVRYPKAALLVGYSSHTTMDRAHEQVVAVITTSPRYRTAAGVGVGSSPGVVRSIHRMTCYGGSQPYACQHGMTPGKTGTALDFRDGKVWRVTIGVSGIFG